MGNGREVSNMLSVYLSSSSAWIRGSMAVRAAYFSSLSPLQNEQLHVSLIAFHLKTITCNGQT